MNYNNELKESVLFGISRFLRAIPTLFRIAETTVYSAAYQQWLVGQTWAKGAKSHYTREALWRACFYSLRDGLFTGIEFGVASGAATKWWARSGIPFLKWYGFDTFKGLPEDWYRGSVFYLPKGHFDGRVPKISASYKIEWVAGLIENNLNNFSRPDGKLFIIIDSDLLEPARSVLNWTRQNGRPGDIIYFDEVYDPWNEGLALREAIDSGCKYKCLGYTGSTIALELV